MYRMLCASFALCACGSGMAVGPSIPNVVQSRLVKKVGPTMSATSTALAGVNRLSVAAGKPVVMSDTQVFALGSAGAEAMLVGDTGTSTAFAKLNGFGQRDQSAFVLASDGLYSLVQNRFLKSPLSTAGLSAISSIGSGTGEEVWLVSAQGLQWWKASSIQDVDLKFDAVNNFKPEQVIALSKGRAVVTGAGQALLVDVPSGVVKWVAQDIGQVMGFSRAAEDSALLATEQGLLEVSASGTTTLRKADAAIVATAQLGGSSYALLGNDIVKVAGDSAEVMGTVASPLKNGLAASNDGTLWALDGAAVKRFSSAAPVSFAAEVKPFTTAKCQTCHNGAYAPLQRFDTFDVAKARATEIVSRLKGDDAKYSRMPPASAGTLTPSEYEVFIRWAEGGFLP
jgi:hypothetical protein